MCASLEEISCQASLPVEVGRHQGTPRAQSVCTYCDMGSVGNERHVLLQCPTLASKL